MMKFINKCNILASCQYGFRPNHSINYAIMYLVNTVTRHLDNEDKSAALVIDTSNASDSLNHKILWQKLYAYEFKAQFIIG